MKTRITLTLFMIVLCGSLCEESVKKNKRTKRSEIFSIIESAPAIFRELSDIWHLLLRHPTLSPYDAIFRSKEHEILGRITTINKNVMHLEQTINGVYGSLLDNIASAIPKIVKTELKLDRAMEIMGEIDIAQNELRDYLSLTKINETFEDVNRTRTDEEFLTGSHSANEDMENEVNPTKRNSTIKKEKTGVIEKSTLITFAAWATGPASDSIKTLLGRLHRVVLPRNRVESGIFYLLSDPNTTAQHHKTFGSTELSEQIRATHKLLDELWGYLSETNNINQNMSPQDLLQHFIEIDDNITSIEDGMSNKDFFILSSMWNYAQVEADVMSINSYYDSFKKLQDNVKRSAFGAVSELAWTDLAETFLQNNEYGLIKITDKLHHHVTDSDPSNLFELARQDLGTTACNFKQSPHQVLYNLYNAVSLADYKGYIMLQFSYMILRLYDKGNFTLESERETQKFEQRAEERANAISNVLTNADRGKYNCDPKQYVEGLNYVRLTRLLQGYIENEVNLNPYGTCRENCAYYYYTEYHGCYKEQFCSKQEQCRGKVVECKYVDSDMNICKSSDQERRYDWVEYEDSSVLGTKGKCQTRNLFQVDSWWRYLFWHCSYCLCLCDNGNYNSDRYFNLRKVTSDVEENKVITGVRIVKHNRIIHLQIQQGVLKKRGVIDKSTVSWKPVDNYTIYDNNVENGVDYHTMNWMDRIIDIDEAIGPDEHALTGIRLRKIGYHLNLEIRTTPINFTTGKVYPEAHSLWQGNENTEVTMTTPRKEILLTNPDIPIRNGPHTIDSQPNQYIKFQASSFDSDVAQTTVPYLDAQPIVSHGFPLSGFGFIHRGKPGSGGFIAPKLITYNFRPHV